jgi:carboxyl-terminal processing protease
MIISIGLILTYSFFDHRGNQTLKAKAPPSFASISSEPLEVETDQESIANDLLIESILSIIQNYYVDQTRVSSRELLVTGLKHLDHDPHITVSERGSFFTLRYDNQEIVFEVPKTLDYQEMLTKVKSISSFLNSRLRNGSDTVWHNSGTFMFINSMLSGLDVHSALLDKGTYLDLRQGTEGAFGGVGVIVGIKDNLLTVIKPLKNSPAARVGIHHNDRIMKINDINTYGISLDSLVEHMRGAPGTVIDLSLLREGAVSPAKVSLTREIIHVNSVESEILTVENRNFLQVHIESFANQTTDELIEAVESAEKKVGKIHGIILDLRSNPGGLLDQAIKVSDLFLREGKIVSTLGRRQEVEQANFDVVEFDHPLVVLINGESASASEIVSGALQDHNRAVIIGQPSFGKGSVQTVFELPGEQALKLTIAKYLTPQGRSIQDFGIVPDVWLLPVSTNVKPIQYLSRYPRIKNQNILESSMSAKVAAIGGTKNYNGVGFKGYYLNHNPPDGMNVEPVNDTELQFAATLLLEVNKHYGDTLPEGTWRASHWLALASKQLGQKIAAADAEATAWLKDKIGIDWKAPRTVPINPPKLIVGAASELNAAKGNYLTLPWVVENLDDETASRVSLFAYSQDQAMGVQEVLVGTIPGHKQRTGYIEIPIPATQLKSRLVLNLGISIDGVPVYNPAKTILINVDSKHEMFLDLSSQLVNEVGGNVAGFLEAGEKGKLRVEVENKGDLPLKNLKLRVANLSGTQVELRSPQANSFDLDPGDLKAFELELNASKTLISETLSFGIEVGNQDIVLPARSNALVPSVPNSTQEKLSKIYSH